MKRIEQFAKLMRQLREVTETFNAWLYERQTSKMPLSDKEERFIDAFDTQLHKAFAALSEMTDEDVRKWKVAKGRSRFFFLSNN
jgi:hypothetical protein